MKSFDIEYSMDLLEINKRLKNEKDKNIINQLLEDRKYILKYLGNISKREMFTYKKQLNEEDVVDFLSHNPINEFKLKGIKFFNVNHKKLSLLTMIFINKQKFKLYPVYSKIIQYNGIKFTEKNSDYLGLTKYIKSLDKNYIEIKKQNKIGDYITLIHELGHAKVNSICNDANQCFGETYPIFLELVFSDWLKKNGLIKEAYNLKISLLIQVRNYFSELCDELRRYLYRSEEYALENYFFEYKYNVVRQIILGFYLYDMYLTNSQETLIKIDYFILNSNKMSEEQLLNILGIDNSIFDNSKKMFKKIYDNLNRRKY